MKIFSLVLLLLAAPALRAQNVDDFSARVRSEYLKPFALDLGGVLGGASAHTGRAIGFPGVWAGVVGAAQFRPDKDNRIMRDAGTKGFGIPMVEVGVGLPLRIDAIVHGVTAHDIKIFGGGLRWGILRPGTGVSLVVPSLSVSAFGNTVNHTHFSAGHGSLNFAASWKLPFVDPFLVAGGDVTEVKVKRADVAGLVGTKATARGTRFAAGAEFKPFPFLRIRGAYALRHGMPGADFGLGVAF